MSSSHDMIIKRLYTTPVQLLHEKDAHNPLPAVTPKRLVDFFLSSFDEVKKTTICNDIISQKLAGEKSLRENWTAERIIHLQNLLKDYALDGLVLPLADPHLGEALPDHYKYLHWLTGFDGSTGLLIVTLDKAHLFVDGRYITQAENQTDPAYIDVHYFRNPTPIEWLAQNFKASQKIGVLKALVGQQQFQQWIEKIEPSQIKLIAVAFDRIASIWTNRPPAPLAPIVQVPKIFTGWDISEKCTQVAKKLSEKNADYLLINDLEMLAWISNLRGSDTKNTPLFEGHGVLSAQGKLEIWTDLTKCKDIASNSTFTLHDAERFYSDLSQKFKNNQKIWIDPQTSNADLVSHIQETKADIVFALSPIATLQAVKHEIEIEGMREAHRQDGVAFEAFHKWLEQNWEKNITELDVVEALEACRAKSPDYRGPSFDTICGSGPNGAVIHYRVTQETNRTLQNGDILLLDSGGQYVFGTTDITRCYALGAVSDEIFNIASLVYKGHQSLACAKFPENTPASALDAFARQFLWKNGLNYDHGTGHGVGCYLNVHEGPYRISPQCHDPLVPNVIVSNEPGYYRKGEFGIRLENLLLVKNSEIEGFLEFETLTQVPMEDTLYKLK